MVKWEKGGHFSKVAYSLKGENMGLPDIKTKRHTDSLAYALDYLKGECPDDILDVYLYGSVARGEQKYESDVDLAVFLKKDAAVNVRKLRSELVSDDLDLPEVDAHFFRGKIEDQPESCYFYFVRKDGISVWNQS
jgi:predicted nucleotidyltransferase